MIEHGQQAGTIPASYSRIDTYVSIDHSLHGQGVEDRISSSKDRDGVRGVLQNSSYVIGREDYSEFLRALGKRSFSQEL